MTNLDVITDSTKLTETEPQLECSNKSAWALKSLKRGLSVFPTTWTEDEDCSCGTDDCKVHKSRHGKHPLPGSRGFKDAVDNEFAVMEKWDEYPLANIGVYPGKDHVVIDIDLKNHNSETGEMIDGMENLSNFLNLTSQEVLDMTYTVRTTSGGYHLYFTCETSFPNSVNLIPGIDVRGVNGYVLGPGSDIHGKTYDVITDIDMVPVPDDIEDLLGRVKERDDRSDTAMFEWDSPSGVDRVRELLKTRAPAVTNHGGNHHTYCTAALARDHAVSLDKLLEIVMEPDGWNSRCDPPWSYDELTGPAGPFRNAYEYAKHRPGVKGGDDDALIAMGADAEEDDFFKAQDCSEIMEKLGLDTKALDLELPSREKFSFSSYCDWKGFGKPRPQLIKDWLPSFGTSFILAKRGVGKTLVGIDLACHIAHDLDWMGHKTDKGWYCLFLPGEDPQGTADNIEAWHRHHSKTRSDRFVLPDKKSKVLPDLTNRNDCTELVTAIKNEIPAGARVAVFLDTWARSVGGADRNEGQQAQKLMESAEWIAEQLNGCVVAMAHPPKNDGGTISGGMEQENASAAILVVESDSTLGLQFKADRVKGSRDGHRVQIQHIEVSLENEAPNRKGSQRIGLVSTPRADVAQISEESVLRNHAGAVILEALQDALRGPKPKDSLSKNYIARVLNGHEFEHHGASYKMPSDSTLRHGKLEEWFSDGWTDKGTGMGIVLNGQFSLVQIPDDDLQI